MVKDFHRSDDVINCGLESEETRWTHLKSEGGACVHACVKSMNV